MSQGLLFTKTSTCYGTADIEYLDETSEYKLDQRSKKEGVDMRVGVYNDMDFFDTDDKAHETGISTKIKGKNLQKYLLALLNYTTGTIAKTKNRDYLVWCGFHFLKNLTIVDFKQNICVYGYLLYILQ